MKNMYAVKCLYSYKFYDINHSLIEDITPSWDERIILIKANSVEEVENKINKYAKEYENSYINEDNQIVEIRLYEVIDIYALFDTNDRTYIEVYSNIFSAKEKDIKKVLNITYPLGD